MLLEGTNYISLAFPITHDTITLGSHVGWAVTHKQVLSHLCEKHGNLPSEYSWKLRLPFIFIIFFIF